MEFFEMKANQYVLFVLLSIILFFVIGAGVSFMSLVAVMNGQLHSQPRLIVIGVIVYVVAITLLLRLSISIRYIALFCIAAVIALSVTSIKQRQYTYEMTIPTVRTEVDIHQYEPFTKSNKLPRLGQPASLQLQDPLPALDGATALYPVYAAFVEATYPSAQYPHHDSPIRMTTTPKAYQRLHSGEADVIFVAAPDEEQRAKAGHNLELTPIGKEAFVFFVNRKNPVNNLTLQQIQAIYAGEFTNWKQVGGNDEPIRAFQRPPGSGSQSALVRLMHDKPLTKAPNEDVAVFMGGIITEVANYRNFPNAIGYSFRFFSTSMIRNREIKLLAVDGVAPTKDTIRSGEYPITELLYAATAGTDNPNVQPFIDWILSEEGQQLIEKAGYVPLYTP